uniref:F-box domain-containing protein n=2 Tax=Caenorhabditis tropicalis TaxID=1561998 RepID=A0A1I7UDZ4_9PELO
MPFSYPFMFDYPEKRRHRLINLPEQINRLSLHNSRSLEVFANPLLMEKILDGIECFDIQCLRKVSRDIRSCIDLLKPNPHIGQYTIRHFGRKNYPETMEAFIFLRNLFGTRIWYRNREFTEHEDNFLVHNSVYCGDQLIERLVNDFEINMKHQKSKMMKFSLESKGTANL